MASPPSGTCAGIARFAAPYLLPWQHLRVDFDFVRDSSSHRALLRSLSSICDRTGESAAESAVAEITPYQRPDGAGSFVDAVIVPNADGSPPDWISRMFDELSADGLVIQDGDALGERRWKPSASARERLASLNAEGTSGGV